MDKSNKDEKTGAKTPATSSKVEETQEKGQGQLDLSATNTQELSAVVDTLKAEVETKDLEITKLKQEHEDFKEKLKPEVKKLKDENDTLKAEVDKLKAELGKSGAAKSKGQKSNPKFIVINAFRGNKEGEGIFELESDVSHFDEDRLNSLIERGLVKKV